MGFGSNLPQQKIECFCGHQKIKQVFTLSILGGQSLQNLTSMQFLCSSIFSLTKEGKKEKKKQYMFFFGMKFKFVHWLFLLLPMLGNKVWGFGWKDEPALPIGSISFYLFKLDSGQQILVYVTILQFLQVIRVLIFLV